MALPVWRYIHNNSAEQTIHLGEDAATGQVFFENKGLGYTIQYHGTAGRTAMGAGATLAMGLTECCARFGRGKVYYFCKLGGARIEGSYWPPGIPVSYAELPDLIYVDFIWSEDLRQNWFTSPQWQRLQQLSARANTIDPIVPILPITLFYERDNYDHIRFMEGSATVALYYNGSGMLYLGYVEDMSQHAQWHSSERNAQSHRSFWQGQTSDLSNFQMSSGQNVVQRLRAIYQQQVKHSICQFREILQRAIRAHDEWVAGGGYTLTYELGADIAAKVQALLDNAVPQNTAGDRLQQLRAEKDGWSRAAQDALNHATTAASEGALAMLRYTIEDDNWKGLSDEEKQTILEYMELEDEAAARAQGSDIASETTESQQDDSEPPAALGPSRQGAIRGGAAARGVVTARGGSAQGGGTGVARGTGRGGRGGRGGRAGRRVAGSG